MYIMLLPDEIINLILSFREVNPTAKLIRETIKDTNYSVFESYYKHALMKNQERIYFFKIHKLEEYYDIKREIIKNKKLSKENRIKRNNKNFDNYYNKRKEYNYNFEKFYMKLSEDSQ